MSPTGPVKGAVALANALAADRSVTLVSLKGGAGADAEIDSRVDQRSLPEYGNGWRRVAAYRRMLRAAGGRAKAASISSCFSADMVNLLCRDDAVTCASVRGNLNQVYRMHYGPLGVPLAIAHLTALRGMHHVVAMTAAMAAQMSRYTGSVSAVIGNFVDEQPLERYRDTSARHGPLRFVFLGRLASVKQPGLLIDALAELRAAGVELRADIIGDGPLRASLLDRIDAKGMHDEVVMHGHLKSPYSILTQADALVLPSVSEGMSRAALEALHLGVPCVLRNSDGNAELVQPGVNGALFDRDSDLPDALLAAAQCRRESIGSASLLPVNCRQHLAARHYLELVEAA